MDNLRYSLSRRWEHFVRAARFRKYHSEAAGIPLGAWDKLVFEVVRAGRPDPQLNCGPTPFPDAAFPLTTLKASDASEIGLHELEFPDSGPLDRIARSRARKKRASVISQYGDADPDSIYIDRFGFQTRFSSTLQEASFADSRAPIHLEFGDSGIEGGQSPLRAAWVTRKPPPKGLGATSVVWKIHQVLAAAPWGLSTEEALGRLDLQLGNHHVSQVLRGLKDSKLALEFFNWCKGRDGYRHDALNYNMMVAMLATSRSPKLVLPLLEDMVAEGWELYDNTLITMIMNFDRADEMGDLLQIFDNLGKYNKRPHIGVYTCLIDVLSKRNETELVKKFFSLIRDLEYALDNTAYNVLIRTFGRSKNIDLVRSLFQEMVERGCKPDTYTFGFLVTSLARAGRVEEAHARLKDMADSGLTPDVFTYNILIDGFGRSGDLDQALELLTQMVEKGLQPDVVTYNSLFDALGKCNRVDEAEDLYNEMLGRGISPNKVTCSILVESLGRAGKLDTACDIFLSIMKTPGLKMDVIVYNSMLNRLGKAGRLVQVKKLFEEMKESGQQPDAFTYNIVIDALCRDQDLDMAKSVFIRMKAAGCRPDVVTYNTLIHNFGKAGKVARANKIFNQMLRDGLTPDHLSYNIMINVLGKARKTDQALKALKDMQAKGMSPDVITYNRLIDTFGKAGDCKAATFMYDEMLECGITPDKITFTVLIDGLAKNCKMDTAWRVYREMRERGLRADVVTFNCLISGYIREGRMAEANDILIRMKGSRCEPSSTTYAMLIDGNARYNNEEMAFKLRKERIDAGFSPAWNEVM